MAQTITSDVYIRALLAPRREQEIKENHLKTLAIILQGAVTALKYYINHVKDTMKTELENTKTTLPKETWKVLKEIEQLPRILPGENVQISDAEIILITMAKAMKIFLSPTRVWKPSQEMKRLFNQYLELMRWMAAIADHLRKQTAIPHQEQFLNLADIQNRHISQLVNKRPPKTYMCSGCDMVNHHWRFQCNKTYSRLNSVDRGNLKNTKTSWEYFSNTRSEEIWQNMSLWHQLSKLIFVEIVKLTDTVEKGAYAATVKNKNILTLLNQNWSNNIGGEMASKFVAYRKIKENFPMFITTLQKLMKPAGPNGWIPGPELLAVIKDVRQLMIQLLIVTLLKYPENMGTDIKKSLYQSLIRWLKIAQPIEPPNVSSTPNTVINVLPDYIDFFAANGLYSEDLNRLYEYRAFIAAWSAQIVSDLIDAKATLPIVKEMTHIEDSDSSDEPTSRHDEDSPLKRWVRVELNKFKEEILMITVKKEEAESKKELLKMEGEDEDSDEPRELMYRSI